LKRSFAAEGGGVNALAAKLNPIRRRPGKILGRDGLRAGSCAGGDARATNVNVGRAFSPVRLPKTAWTLAKLQGTTSVPSHFSSLPG